MNWDRFPLALILLLLPVFLAELAFFLLPASARFRKAFDRLPGLLQSLALLASALTPFLLLHLPQGSLRIEEAAILAAIATLISFWFLVLPRKPFFDLLLLVVLAALLLNKPWWAPFYPSPNIGQGLNISILGQSLWYRLGIAAFLLQRRWAGTNFGFLPSRQDWIIGLQQFVLLVCVLFPLLYSYGTVRFQLPALNPWLILPYAILSFFAILWVLAVWEEFFFRGVLQQLLTRETGNRWVALLLTSLLFGAVHLPYRQFPNWRFALAATIAGVFYGLAFQRAQSIRAAMVTHALVVTAWTILFARSI